METLQPQHQRAMALQSYTPTVAGAAAHIAASEAVLETDFHKVC